MEGEASNSASSDGKPPPDEKISRRRKLTPAERLERMRKIRKVDTKPEMIVRRAVHALGYRYRLHAKDLPGRPDLVFRTRNKVIFVHGCLWHSHEGCPNFRPPRDNKGYWVPKLERNRARDMHVQNELLSQGWGVLIIWECEVKDAFGLNARLSSFLESSEDNTRERTRRHPLDG